jgi:lipopolysaccharide transport system permease protein
MNITNTVKEEVLLLSVDQQNGKEEETWDLVIEPKAKLLDLHLGEVWRYRDLMFLFVKRDFVAQFKQTILGPVWHFVQPIFTTLMFLLVFTKIANIDTDGVKPVLFYMSGIAIWNYFASCLNATSSTFVANAGIFGKVYFPRLVLPLSSVISNIIKFGIQFSLLAIMMLYYVIFDDVHVQVGLPWLLIPLLVLMMAGLGLGVGIIISSLTTKYRDLTILLGFAVQLLMYATPVAYPLSYLQSKSYASWIQWNPISPIVEAFRYSLFGSGTFTVLSLIYSGVFIIITLFVGLVIFNRVEKSFMDTV